MIKVMILIMGTCNSIAIDMKRSYDNVEKVCKVFENYPEETIFHILSV